MFDNYYSVEPLDLDNRR